MKPKTFNVVVWLHQASRPIHHKATNSYQKGSFYCVLEPDIDDEMPVVHKYPIQSLFRVDEDYFTSENET